MDELRVIRMNPQERIDAVLAAAAREIGTPESKAQKYRDVIGAEPGTPWCVPFVVYCIKNGLGYLPFPCSTWCSSKFRYYARKKKLIYAEPQPGDVFMHTYKEGSRGGCCWHVGLVEEIISPQTFWGIEGNATRPVGEPNVVRRKRITTDYFKTIFFRWNELCSDVAAIDQWGVNYWNRFWSKVDGAFGDSDACWLWTAAHNHLEDGGHGRFKLNGDMPPAHRVAWLLLRGPISANVVICHRCPEGVNPLCCNPKHLAIDTQKENVRDAWRQNRAKYNHGFGDKSPNHTIPDAGVIRIRAEMDGLPFRSKERARKCVELAVEFNVTKHCIQAITSGRKRIIIDGTAE